MCGVWFIEAQFSYFILSSMAFVGTRFLLLLLLLCALAAWMCEPTETKRIKTFQMYRSTPFALWLARTRTCTHVLFLSLATFPFLSSFLLVVLSITRYNSPNVFSLFRKRFKHFKFMSSSGLWFSNQIMCLFILSFNFFSLHFPLLFLFHHDIFTLSVAFCLLLPENQFIFVNDLMI